MLDRSFTNAVEVFREVAQGNYLAATKLGYTVLDTESFWFIKPGKGFDRVGCGFILAKKWTRNVVLQVPHLNDEVHLPVISTELHNLTGARAVWVNTLRRRVFDPAHELDNHFNAATVAFSDVVDLFVSLHGFKSPEYEIIVSGGSLIPTIRSWIIARELYQDFEGTYMFPNEVECLGGMGNYQGNILRSLGYPEQFLHIELARGLRNEMVAKPAVLRKFGILFAQGLDAKLDAEYKDVLSLHGHWTLPLGVEARRTLGPEGVINTLAQLDTPRKLAHTLGVNVTEVNHYLNAVPKRQESGSGNADVPESVRQNGTDSGTESRDQNP